MEAHGNSNYLELGLRAWFQLGQPTWTIRETVNGGISPALNTY